MARILENGYIKIRGFLRLAVVPQKWNNFLHGDLSPEILAGGDSVAKSLSAAARIANAMRERSRGVSVLGVF